MITSPFTMVVWIVAIACGFSLAKHWIDSRANRPSGDDRGTSDETLELISRLEHRIEVLERIVTDSGNSLRREIDRL
ncbi:MAG: hypothetical protein AAGA84_11010 [Pseudomonadota bacterium]